MKKKTKIFLALIAILLLMAVLWSAYKGNKSINQPDCTSYPYDKCPSGCVVCPPCASCSSIRCEAEEYCQSIGFNRSWYEQVRPK